MLVKARPLFAGPRAVGRLRAAGGVCGAGRLLVVRLGVVLIATGIVQGPSAPAAAAASTARESQGVPLPAPKPGRPSAAAGRACHVGSFTGVMMPGSTVCVKIGGFVRAETGSGGASHP